jgi:GH15 family glucan-1,4-alpha-glucosidase
VSTTPIADYALLSDRHSAALVSRDGSVDWLCFPRFDSPSIFARLLGDGAGHWSIRATGTQQVNRRYLDRTMVLETTCRTPTGTVVLVDALAMGEGNKGHELGRDAPHLLLRQATCTEGEVEMKLEYAPRPEYGLIYPLLEVVDGGLSAIGGADELVVSSPVTLTIDRSSASGLIRLRRGEDAGFALHHSKQGEGERARVWPQSEIAERLTGTVSAWESWSDLHQAYAGPWHDLVHHSGRVLQALSFQPTGAICAAATTSLPETVGGSRNWDYRYTWARDASFTIEALWVAACPDEANQFFEYVTNSAAGSLERGADLQIMFGVGGERDLTERELTRLNGWRGSVPVRVGNGAWSQRQLDVYGELLNAVFRLSDHLFDQVSRRVGPLAGPDKWGAPPGLTPATKRFLVELADAAASRWQEKDQGIWEIRSEPRDFLYSKVMPNT